MKEVKKIKGGTAKDEPRETQGHKKMLQIVEDLKRNKRFLKDFRRYEKTQKDEGDEFYKGWWYLLQKYFALDAVAKKLVKKRGKDHAKASAVMAECYGLDGDLMGYVLCSNEERLGRLGFNPYENYLDMCIWHDNHDKYFAADYYDVPFVLDTKRQNHLQAYPISIDIHRYASKRDVLDYIEKNWESIYVNSLNIYTEKKVRIRERKLKREIVDFIWANKTKKGKEIKKLLDEKFPHNGLVYYEIPKIISVERERRLG